MDMFAVLLLCMFSLVLANQEERLPNKCEGKKQKVSFPRMCCRTIKINYYKTILKSIKLILQRSTSAEIYVHLAYVYILK